MTRAAAAGRPGRRPDGQATRARILTSARAEFGALGYDGATIRGIAARAGVDPALVHHYFGPKQRLFVATMEAGFPVDFEVAVAAVLDGPPDTIGERLVRYVLELWEAPAFRAVILGLVRSAASDAAAATMLRHVLSEGPFLALARAIARPDARLRATLVGTQLVGLAMARYVVEVEPIATADVDVLARAIGPSIQRYLAGDLGAGGAAPA